MESSQSVESGKPTKKGDRHKRISSLNISENDPLIKDDNISKNYHQSGIFSQAIVFSNANIGIGTIGLAYGISKSGWLLAIILFVICHGMNHFTVFIMMEIASTMDVASYAIVCNKCKVPILQIISDWSMVINKTLSCTSYLIIIGDYMSRVMTEMLPDDVDDFWKGRHIWIVIFVVVCVIPTMVVRKLDALKNSSFIAMLCFVYFIVVVILYLTVDKLRNNIDSDPDISPFPVPDKPLEFFKTISLYIYAYGGHPIAFGATSELKDPTLSRINKVIWMFCCFSTFVFASIGFGGYFTFGTDMDANLLLNYPDNRGEIIAVRIAMCIAVAFSYPVLGNAIKNSLASIVYGVGVPHDKYSFKALTYKLMNYNNTGVYKNIHANHSVLDISNVKFYSLVIIIVSITFILAMSTNELGVIFQFNGATVGTFNQVLFPALIYVFAYRNLDNNQIRDHKYGKYKYYLAIFIGLLGAILIPFMVIYAIDDLING